MTDLIVMGPGGQPGWEMERRAQALRVNAVLDSDRVSNDWQLALWPCEAALEDFAREETGVIE